MEGLDGELLKHRGKHDALGLDMVRHGSRTVAARVVVRSDRGLIRSLEERGLLRAFEKVAMAFSIRTAGLGMSAMDYARARGCGGNLGYGADLLARYDEWMKNTGDAGRLVISVIERGVTMRGIDRQNGWRNGRAMGMLVSALEMWR